MDQCLWDISDKPGISFQFMDDINNNLDLKYLVAEGRRLVNLLNGTITGMEAIDQQSIVRVCIGDVIGKPGISFVVNSLENTAGKTSPNQLPDGLIYITAADGHTANNKVDGGICYLDIIQPDCSIIIVPNDSI